MLIIMIAHAFHVKSSDLRWKILKGPYLGQAIPENQPKLFAPGYVSTGDKERCGHLVSDGKTFYWWLGGIPHSIILFTEFRQGHWTAPRIFRAFGKLHGEFTLSVDGNTFLISAPVPGEIEKRDIWMSQKKKGKWSEPVRLHIPMNPGYPSIARNGNLYFFAIDKSEHGDADIYFSRYHNQTYMPPESLGNSINTSYHEVDPFIDPEEKYILFHRNVPGREGLHVSERRQNKAWAKARLIPGTKNAICPFVTSDRKFLFFSNNWKLKMPVTCQSYRETIKILRSAGNGFNDIYWVSADILGLDKIKK